MNRMVTLLRRELWEHRGLVWAPVVTAVCLVIAIFAGGSRSGAVRIAVNDREAQFMQTLTGPAQEKFFGVFTGVLLVPQLVVALIVLFFYLLDTLYSERKDRSILFWKSMPVSDAETIASKVLVALLLVPLWVWVLSLAASVLGFGALALSLSGTPFASLATWHTGGWLTMQATLLMNLVIAALWYAPVAGYLLILSAFARRAVFMWAVVPPVLLMFLEEVAFNTNYLLRFIGYRLGGFFAETGSGARPEPTSASEVTQVFADLHERISALPMLANIDLWLGLIAAIALFYGAVRLRRWRDDT